MTRTDNSPVPDFPGRLRLDGKGVVLVGAGTGIGRQTAHALAQCGARVMCVDLEPDLADEIAAEVGGIAWAGDATERPEMERLVRDSTSRHSAGSTPSSTSSACRTTGRSSTWTTTSGTGISTSCCGTRS